MPYNLTLTNGTVLETLADGFADTTTTSVSLIGKNYAGYGIYLNENFIKLLENFANSTAPANPLKGQIWWDTTNVALKVWNGSAWSQVGGATPSTIPPSALQGALWFNTSTGTLEVYNGADWTTIGPDLSALQGTYYSKYATNGSRNVGNVLVNNTTTAVVVAEAGFTASPAINGLTNLVQGWNIVNNISAGGDITAGGTVTATGLTITGPATINGQTIATTNGGGTASFAAINSTPIGNATPSTGAFTSLSSSSQATLATAVATNFSTANAVISGGSVNSTPIGATAASTGAFTTLSATGLSITGTATLNGAAIATVGGGGLASFSAINGTVIGNTTPSTGAFTTITATTSIKPTGNLSVDLGDTTHWFNNIYGTAIHAQYADLAERFAADKPYSAGTVVELGGPAEIISTSQDLSENVFGVISTNAAYLMNSRAGNNSTHPPVAVQGRVPVKVVGTIRKGDRLVSAGNGLARAGKRNEITTWNVIGRALEDKMDNGEGVIEAVVKLNS